MMVGKCVAIPNIFVIDCYPIATLSAAISDDSKVPKIPLKQKIALSLIGVERCLGEPSTWSVARLWILIDNRE